MSGRGWIEQAIEMLAELGPDAVPTLEALLDDVAHQLAALAYDWAGTWARPSGAPAGAPGRSYGSWAVAGGGRRSRRRTSRSTRSRRAALASALVGQSERRHRNPRHRRDRSRRAHASMARRRWEASSNRLVFGTGAIATIYTAQEPNGLRGPQHDLAIATEIAAWPASSADEAMSNLLLGLRLGYGKLLWDATPKRRNPLIRERLALSAKSPDGTSSSRARRGTTRSTFHRRSSASGTSSGAAPRAAQELDGRYFDDDDDALFHQAWIDTARRGWRNVS